MKKVMVFPAIVLTLALAGCTEGGNTVVSGGKSDGVYPYPFKSAKITYSISGTNPGEEILYVKGDNSVRESHLTPGGKAAGTKQNKLYISKGEIGYMVDLDKKTALKIENPFYEELKQIDASKRVEYVKKLALGISDPKTDYTTPKSTGTENVAGQTCETYNVKEYGTACLWGGLVPLKSSINLPEANLVVNTVATKVELNVNIPDSKFDVPTDVVMKENRAGL